MAWTDAARRAAAATRKTHKKASPYGGTRQQAAKVLKTMKANTKQHLLTSGFGKGRAVKDTFKGMHKTINSSVRTQAKLILASRKGK